MKVKEALENYLKKIFMDEPEKQDIVIYNNRINFACPFCGDSKHDPHKKRGNIYLNTMTFVCFNASSEYCASPHSIISFLKKTNLYDKIDPESIKEFKKISAENIGKMNKISSSLSLSYNLNIEDYGIDIKEFYKLKSFIDSKDKEHRIELVHPLDHGGIRNYLIKRKQDEAIEKGRFLYDPFRDDLFILNKKGKKIVSFQIRKNNLQTKYKSKIRFRTVTYTEMCEKYFKKDISNEKDLDIKERLSNVYNIFNINFNLPVLAFESAIDSHHFRNSIAILGTSSIMRLKNMYYVYDNPIMDKAGKIAAMKSLNEGRYTFIWKKFLQRYNKYKNCKDFNDIFVKGANLKFEDLRPFFSNSKFDKLWI